MHYCKRINAPLLPLKILMGPLYTGDKRRLRLLVEYSVLEELVPCGCFCAGFQWVPSFSPQPQTRLQLLVRALAQQNWIWLPGSEEQLPVAPHNGRGANDHDDHTV